MPPLTDHDVIPERAETLRFDFIPSPAQGFSLVEMEATEEVRAIECTTLDVQRALTAMLGEQAKGWHVTAIRGPFDRLGRFLTLVLEPNEER